MSTATYTRSTTVSATESRVTDVLRQVRVDLINAERAGLTSVARIDDWLGDLKQMLLHRALVYFELRLVGPDGTVGPSWRYTISDDGSLTEVSRGGGINFYGSPHGASATLVIQRRADLLPAVSDLIASLGWNNPVAPLLGDGVSERSYSKDAWGVKRTRIGGWQ